MNPYWGQWGIDESLPSRRLTVRRTEGEWDGPTALVGLPPRDWVDRARCVAHPPQIEGYKSGYFDPFFPEHGETARYARECCQMCKVRTECLAYAMETEAVVAGGGRYGVFGGYTAKERRRIHQGFMADAPHVFEARLLVRLRRHSLDAQSGRRRVTRDAFEAA